MYAKKLRLDGRVAVVTGGSRDCLIDIGDNDVRVELRQHVRDAQSTAAAAGYLLLNSILGS